MGGFELGGFELGGFELGNFGWVVLDGWFWMGGFWLELVKYWVRSNN